MIFHDHVQRRDSVIEIVRDHRLIGSVEQFACKLDQPLGFRAALG